MLALALVLLFGCTDRDAAEPVLPADEPSVRGTLHVIAYSPSATPLQRSASQILRHTWVRDPGYSAMEDIDLRGFLDGRFIYGWNQPGQIHSRLGRRDSNARFGETELFRTLERWDGLGLPPKASVHAARLEIEVERGPDRPLQVLIYAVLREFEPGGGGTERNNTSPPRAGEVWWGAAEHGRVPWGLPGAGFAAADDPDADTPLMALAETAWEPRQETLVFESTAFAAYAQAQVRAQAPIRLLLKLSDALEDTPGTLLHLYTGDHGELRNPARRPRLRLDWSAPHETLRQSLRVHLENGRSLVSKRIEVGDARELALGFEPAEEAAGDAARPTLQVRGGRGAKVSPWLAAEHPLELEDEWDWVQLRVLAARDPIELGQPFETHLRDTWVRAGPPETRRVEFEWVTPQGVVERGLADYQGDYTWRFSMVPRELGRHRYRFRQDFLKRPYEGAEGVFDVVLLDRENARRQLRALADRLREDPPNGDGKPLPAEAPGFWRLERAALQLETPESLASESGRELDARLTEVRELLGGRKVPPELSLKPMKREF